MSPIVERKKAITKPLQFNKCLDCEIKFQVKRKWQKYCSKLCKFRAWAKLNPRVKRGGI